MYKFIATTLAAICTTGCVSMINVSKVSATGEGKPGIRYFLPQVFLRVIPTTDGNITVDTVYLPDPTHEYAVSAYSFMGNYTIDINRSEEGFLETVSFNSDTTGVAKQLISSQAAVRTAEIDVQAAKAKVETAENKALADKQAAAISATEKAKKDADLALRIADEKVKVLEALEGKAGAPSNLKDLIVSAKLAQAEAIVRSDAAAIAFATTSANMAAANGPANQVMTAPEPVFLKVEMEPTTVKLTKAFEQKDRTTWKIPPTGPSAANFAVRPTTLFLQPSDKSGALTGTVQATMPMLSVVLESVENKGSNESVSIGPSGGPRSTLLFDSSVIRIDMPKNMAAGEYELQHKVLIGPKDKPIPKTVVILVRVDK